MRVSVVLPVLNEERLIGGRLAELAALRVHEVIVVDGGSSDGTCAVVAAHPGVRLLHAPRGRAEQMNAGAAVAQGKVLLFLHADVSLPADALQQVRHALADGAVVGGAFRTWTVPDEPHWMAPLLHLADLRSRCTSLPYGDQAIFVRASAFRRLGGFPAIPIMEDLAFSRKLRSVGKIRTVQASVRVSGRRFLARPVFYTLVVNTFPALFRLGVPPAWLARFYGAVR